MDQERNLGVTEARFALTLLTCLLVAIGYVALLRLGGAKETVVDPGSDDVLPKVTEGDPPKENEQFRVLPVEKPDSDRIQPANRSTNTKRR